MIRAATSHDATAIAALERAGAYHPWTVDSVRAQLELPTTAAFVAEDPHPIAHLLTAVVAGQAEVLTLVVHPDARRRGLGRALLRAATRAWEAAGAVEAFLEVRANNPPARRLYEQEGWRQVGERRDYYGPGNSAVVYQRDLKTDGTSPSS